MTPDDAIAIVQAKAAGRTRWAGMPPFLDEILVGEIERLRMEIGRLDATVSRVAEEGRMADDARRAGEHKPVGHGW